MARPAHPDKHDERLQSILDAAVTEERLIPCPDLATLKLIRSRLREIIRAHKLWETEKFPSLKLIRFKILKTIEVLPSRPNYLVDEIRYPWTLALDAREVITDILALVAGSSTSIPLTQTPTNAREDEGDEWDYDPEEDSTSSDDDYTRLATMYRRPAEEKGP